MTRAEALDAIAQAGPLIEAIERIVRKVMAVLDLPDELLPKDPPKLKVVSITDAKQGDPNDWTYDKLNWDGKVYGDD